MKNITIEISVEVAKTLAQLADHCTEIDKASDGLTSHGALTVESLLQMLANDASMILTRRGSWEGDRMAALFASHGYDI
ncbi:hypothetical protein M2323_001775 [Rhodoblastus acidophilus]|uniref:hypothetical protein n=1 Tax=Rhodoblastus acidophilus TaxID=1074 RepID=UPI002225A47D|nr:hypothetical protein [Rhodoblastus acidophilus]MCW2283793.1 hypothetical protein [Rhodoblastus acidophilus]MCW2332858.1 hypothetical protein [Rhodoblastus acidophilus]